MAQAKAQELKRNSSQELDKDFNKSREENQINSSDIRENLTKPQGTEELDLARALQKGDKYNIQGEGKENGLDVLQERVQNHHESLKQGDSEKNSLEEPKNSSEELKNSLEDLKNSSEDLKNSLEEPKTGEEESSRFSSLKEKIAYTIVSLVETFGMGVSAIARGAVQEFGGEAGGAGANGFSPADMLLLNRGMDPENLTKGTDPERLTGDKEQID